MIRLLGPSILTLASPTLTSPILSDTASRVVGNPNGNTCPDVIEVEVLFS